MDEEVEEVQKKPAIAGESMDNVGTNAVGDGIETKSLLIMFLSALSYSFSPSDGPSLDMCRGDCNKLKRCFHECNIAWLESHGRTNEELTKLCLIVLTLAEFKY